MVAPIVNKPAELPSASDSGKPPQSDSPSHSSPRSVTLIEKNTSWTPLELRALWKSRELLYFLAWRDLKVRYKQAVFGVAWVIMQPLIMTIIFTIFLGRLVQVPSDGVPYALFAYGGLLPWAFFSGAVSATGNSLVGNAPLITKVYFPRIIIPVSSIAARFVDLGVAFLILVGMMVYFRVGIKPQIMLTPLVTLLLAMLALAVGLWTSAVNVKYRDVGIALPVFVQLWMFCSPIVYPMSLVPPRWQLVYSLNPLVGIIEGFRSSLFGLPIKWPPLLISSAVTTIFFIYATYVFRRREKSFADII